MTLRDKIRRIRLYYKAFPLLWRVLRLPLAALFLPLTGARASFRAKNGIVVEAPPGDWDLLPNLCRLAEIGATCRIEGAFKRIEIDGITLYSPKADRVEGDFLREIFREDVYRLRGLDLAGKTAVDVGAYIGDSTLILSRQGAEVYALEPSRITGELFRRNVAANGLESRVHFFNSGLSKEEAIVEDSGDTLAFVEAQSFTHEHLPRRTGLLKMDCEGCEYALLADPRFLDHLEPEVIVMEYHRGPSPLDETLRARGYQVETVRCDERVGYLYATRG
jgi:FkbM family methyltransferase